MIKLIKDFKRYITKEDLLKSSSAFLIALTLREVIMNLVKNLVNPLISIFFKIDSLENFKTVIWGTHTTLPLGSIFESIFNFLILSFTIFLIVEISERSNILVETKDSDEIVQLKTLNQNLENQICVQEKQIQLLEKLNANQERLLQQNEEIIYITSIKEK